VTAPNELLSAASKWIAAGCDGEDEESEAFDNCATCGMGWTENGMSYQDNSAGLYREESIKPLEMYWDTRSARRTSTVPRDWRGRKRFRCGLLKLNDPFVEGQTSTDDRTQERKNLCDV
jgi:hypothetical protein